MTKTLHTIGYEGLRFSQFLELLLCAGIGRLIDVRRYNNVNVFDNNPWCKANLAKLLAAAGIEYEELKLVAPSVRLLREDKYGALVEPCSCRSAKKCPHPRQPLSKDEFRQRYLAELQASDGVRVLHLKLSQSGDRSTVFMCFERDPEECHRKMLMDALVVQYPEEFCMVDISSQAAIG